MNKRLYYTLITIAFGTISIPTLLGIVFQERILIDYIDRAFIKLVLIFFICVVEANFVTRNIPKVIGYVLPIALFIGIQFRVMHWPWGKEIIVGAGLAILINLTTLAIIEKNKKLIHYLLFLFVLQRLIIILTPPNEILWCIDVVVCLVITLAGIGNILNLKILNKMKSR